MLKTIPWLLFRNSGPDSRILHSFSVTSVNINVSDTSLKTRCFELHFCRRKYQGILNHFYVIGHKATEFGEITQTTRPLCCSRSFNVTYFGTNWKLIYDFLLVIKSNLPPILHRFQVMADYWSNFPYRHGSASLYCPRWGWYPANIQINFTSPETRRILLPDAENCTIICSFVWTKHRNVTDKRTDRYPLAITAVCIVAMRMRCNQSADAMA